VRPLVQMTWGAVDEYCVCVLGGRTSDSPSSLRGVKLLWSESSPGARFFDVDATGAGSNFFGFVLLSDDGLWCRLLITMPLIASSLKDTRSSVGILEIDIFYSLSSGPWFDCWRRVKTENC
jgi:hypothetical protein